jgi:hypothetical protein
MVATDFYDGIAVANAEGVLKESGMTQTQRYFIWRERAYRLLSHAPHVRIRRARPLPPAGSGKKLVDLLDQFDFTEQDADDLDRVIASHRSKARE